MGNRIILVSSGKLMNLRAGIKPRTKYGFILPKRSGRKNRWVLLGLTVLFCHITTSVAHSTLSVGHSIEDVELTQNHREGSVWPMKDFPHRFTPLSIVQNLENGKPESAQSNEGMNSEGDGVESDFSDEFEEEFGLVGESEIFDPLGWYNRLMTKVNDGFYFLILRPSAIGYRYVIPEGVRLSVNRFFNNILFPIHFVNNVLQFKFKRAGIELVRFGLNTTVGIAGFADPAKKWLKLQPYPEDFGQTLGYYGLGGGFHLVLPILGPSNFRDTLGLFADSFLDPICYLGSCFAGYWEAALGVQIFKTGNDTSLHIGEYESIKKDAVDLYLFIREAYEQKRKREIKK